MPVRNPGAGAFQTGTWSNWLLSCDPSRGLTTLQLTCTVDRHTIIWVHCAPAGVCSIRTCKYTESAQNNKCGMALGEIKQQVDLKGILDLGFLFQRAALSSDAGQQPCSGQPLTRSVSIPTEKLRGGCPWLGKCHPP